ncbi:MAG: hypothetical protein ACOYOE_12530 [Chlorobium sp.]
MVVGLNKKSISKPPNNGIKREIAKTQSIGGGQDHALCQGDSQHIKSSGIALSLLNFFLIANKKEPF